MYVQPFPRTWVEIDFGAMKHNLRLIKERMGEDVLLSVVCKADGYGHGLVPVGRFAAKNGADWLSVASVQEGVALRDAGLDCPIMVMSPTLDMEAAQAIFYDLDIFVESAHSIKAFAQIALNQERVGKLHLKVDTGLHRFGCDPNDAKSLIDLIKSTPGCVLRGVSQHFLDASNVSRSTAQRDTFESSIPNTEDLGIIHLSASAGAVKVDRAKGGLVRIGMHAYGIDADKSYGGELKPTMRWFARVTSIRTIPAGDTVSYMGTWTASRTSTIATLGAGYGDGYARQLSNKGFIFVNSHRAPVTGLICMDQTMIDVTDIPGVEIGTVVEMLGENIRVPEVAAWAGTNGHEIVTRVMTRVNRRYIYPD